MAKISEVNPYLNTPEKREAAIIRFVIQSSAIEGIHVTEAELSQYQAETRSKGIASQATEKETKDDQS